MNHIATYSAQRTSECVLGEHQPKPTAFEGGVTEAALSIWEHGKIETGLWECTPGAFSAERKGYAEICTLLHGSVTLRVEGEESRRFGPGDVIVMPSGWAGEWEVHEPLRKHYTIIHD